MNLGLLHAKFLPRPLADASSYRLAVSEVSLVMVLIWWGVSVYASSGIAFLSHPLFQWVKPPVFEIRALREGPRGCGLCAFKFYLSQK